MITSLVVACTGQPTPPVTAPPRPAPLGAASPEGFERATGPVPLVFPRDQGPHPDFQTEWWYYTGNLETAEGRHFGFQLTFFRRALLPPAQRQARESGWAADQIYLAHFALSDIESDQFHAFERYGRGAAGLAGAQPEPYGVWLDDWSVAQTGPGEYRLHAQEGELALDLNLTDAKGPVLQGNQGYSQKGPEPGNASYYISQTRLESSGTVQTGGQTLAVTGLSWMDHEYSTSALGADQVGWDWFALQLDDGSELMMFQLRRADGSLDPFSSGTLIDPDGTTHFLGQGGLDFEISVGDTWRSPRSGATYPASWVVRVPEAGLELEIEPYMADQELNVSFTYWEGAVQITGERGGLALAGSGYVEMTGYAGSMQGQF